MDELLARLANIEELSDEEVNDLRSQLADAYRALRFDEDGNPVTPADAEAVAELQSIADAIRACDADNGRRATESAELESQASVIDDLVAEAPEEGEAEEEASPEEEADDGEEAAPAEEEAEAEPELVTAAAPPAAPAPTTLAAARGRQPARTRPRPQAHGQRLLAMAGLPTVNPGTEFTTAMELAEAMVEANSSGVPGAKVKVARVRNNVKRELRSTDNPWTTRFALDEVIGVEALTAAGGVCAPATPIYDVPVISHSSRPVRDSLPSFNADRGAITWIVPPVLSGVGTSGGTPNQAVDQITNAEDDSDTTKPHQTFECGTTDSATIYAATKIAEFGNLMGITAPEQVRAWNTLAEAAWARYAENLLLITITAGSTAVTAQQDLGVAVDILNTVDLAVTGYRSRERMPLNAPFRVMFPAWLANMIRADRTAALAHGLPAYPTLAQINGWLADRNVNVTWFEDGPVGPGSPALQIFPTQAAGALNNWPTVVQWYLFPEGSWVFLDGGNIDLGIVRDSTLNASNKFQIFYESLEQVAHVGFQSYRVRSTICANGGVAGTIDPNALCDGGS